MTFPVALPLGRSRGKHRKFRDIARTAVRRVSVPASIQRISQMPLTVLGIGSTIAGIALICLPAALIVMGPVLVGLEFLVADE